MTEAQRFFTDGAAYERMMGRWSRIAGARFIDWLALPAGLDWLDVGCGNGAFTETLLARNHPRRVIAIDPAPDQIAFARSREASRDADYRVGDAHKLDFAGASFDAVVMALVINFLDEAPKAVAEMARVARPGGMVATYVWHAPEGQPTAPFQRAARALGFSSREQERPEGPVGTDQLQATWLAAGLRDVATTTIDIEVGFVSFEDFWQSCTALPNRSVRFLRDLPPADVEKVRTWLAAALEPDSSGRICYTARANAVKGHVPQT